MANQEINELHAAIHKMNQLPSVEQRYYPDFDSLTEDPEDPAFYAGVTVPVEYPCVHCKELESKHTGEKLICPIELLAPNVAEPLENFCVYCNRYFTVRNEGICETCYL